MKLSDKIFTDFVTFTLIAILPAGVNAAVDREMQSSLSMNITRILNLLVRTDFYDKRLRPNYGGPPVQVNITMHVFSLGRVSEVEMDYTVDIYLRQSWFDPRLTWQNIPVDEITINVEYMESIWVPDTFFPNEKKAYFHTATTHNSFLRITKFGKITTSQRLTVTASCPMDLHYFPLDSQLCSLEIESYGYSTDDIQLQWSKQPGADPVDVSEDCKLPTFQLKRPLIYLEREISLSTGSYSRLTCKFDFHRKLGFYWIQIYQPCLLIVVISWVTFWINRDSAPARVTLGIMTVLTMTTLMSTTNRQMPKVSHVKAVDICLVVCYIMVFAALLEEKDGQFNRVFSIQQTKITPYSPDSLSQRHDSSTSMNHMVALDSPRLSYSTVPESVNQTGFNRLSIPVPTESRMAVSSTTKSVSYDECVKQVASSVDKFSRVIFPCVFTAFNVLYWSIYLKISGKF